MRKILKNKPLVEAIFELRWELQRPHDALRIDPDYKILLGRIYDRLHGEYPFHEELPTARMPDEIAGYMVQHRFRTGEGQWPLIQLGPGIVTVNDTEGYIWESFEDRISDILDRFLEAYPNLQNLVVKQLVLRYIDMVDLDYNENDGLEFLRDKMKSSIALPSSLFTDTEVKSLPCELDLRFCFPCGRPVGLVRLRLALGELQDRRGIIWDTMVQTNEKDVPSEKDEIMTWVIDAHKLVDDWFFKLIEGDLERRFE